MTIRSFLPIAFAISTAFAAPAMAADSTCATAPAQIRTLAASAQPEQARKALSLVSTGEKLCDAGGKNEAGKKFSAAAKLLGTDMAALTNVSASAQ